MADTGVEDRDLVAAVLGGRDEAFRPLVERYQRMVASVAWRYGVRREEIEDVVSEVFFKTYDNLARYTPSHPFSTWLYRLAANHVIDHGRRNRRRGGETDLPEQMADPDPGAEERVDADERATLVRRSLEDLEPHYREALFLVYVEGLRVDETAETLGLPVGTVKSRLKRGRDALGKILRARHPEHFGSRNG